LIGRLLIAALVVAAHTAHHSAASRAYSRTLAGIPGDGADDGAPGRAAHRTAPDATSIGLTRRWRSARRSHGIEAALVLRPAVTLTAILVLLRLTLVIVRKDHQILGHRRRCNRQSE
jgi:hypothetical protein